MRKDGGFISLVEIKAYADYYDLTEKEREYFLPSIVQMDTIYIEKRRSTQGTK